MQWEYKVISGVPSTSVAQLNELGSEGWELVATISIDHTGTTFFYFKRPAENGLGE